MILKFSGPEHICVLVLKLVNVLKILEKIEYLRGLWSEEKSGKKNLYTYDCQCKVAIEEFIYNTDVPISRELNKLVWGLPRSCKT